jgi:hypothetical protein
VAWCHRWTVAAAASAVFGPEMRRRASTTWRSKARQSAVYLFIHDEQVEIRRQPPVGRPPTKRTPLRRELPDPDIQLRYIGPAGKPGPLQRDHGQPE